MSEKTDRYSAEIRIAQSLLDSLNSGKLIEIPLRQLPWFVNNCNFTTMIIDRDNDLPDDTVRLQVRL